MTIQTITHVARSGVTPSPVSPPTPSQVAHALRVLANAVEVAQVAVVRPNDGATRIDVSTIGMSPDEADSMESALLTGMTGVWVESWTAAGLVCREATGMMLAATVRVISCTGTRDQVALAGGAR